MIIIITGAPGSGKTKTVKQLLETTLNSAAIDGDLLLGINPDNRTDNERWLRYKNIADVARNYHQSGFKTIFIAYVYGQSQLTMQLSLLKDIDETRVFVLTPSEQALRFRHMQDDYKRASIDASLELNNTMLKLENVYKIDNTNMTIYETARKVKQVIGLA